MASLYICKLEINANLQEKTLASWDMSIHHVSTVSCVSLQNQSFYQFWSVAMVALKQQKNRVCACLESIKSN